MIVATTALVDLQHQIRATRADGQSEGVNVRTEVAITPEKPASGQHALSAHKFEAKVADKNAQRSRVRDWTQSIVVDV